MKRRELRVTRGKTAYTFSVGELVESLQGVGVTTDQAISLARALDKSYRNSGDKKVKLDKLVNRVAKSLAEEVGEDAAERFRVQTPPFVPLNVLSDEQLSPFSRRKLASSLEKVGLRFKEAYAIAGQIEQNLRSKGYEFVSKPELTHLVALALEARFGRDERIRYETASSGSADIHIVETDGVSFPFSRGILARSLMGIGLGPELSYTFAQDVENLLLHKSVVELSRDALQSEVEAFLLEEAGEEFARRFHLLRSVRRPDRPIIIIIGGAPGAGKSALAAELAYRLGIRRVVSSDAVREALRSLVGPQLSPILHRSSYSAWRSNLLPGEQTSAKPKRKRVTRAFLAQAQQLSTALMAITERSVREASSAVLEGAHLVPGLLPLSRAEDATVVELVLAVADEKRHRAHFELRDKETEQRRSQQPYFDHFEEIRMIHDFIVRRAENEGVPVVDVSRFEEAVERTLELVLETSLTQGGDKRLPPQDAETSPTDAPGADTPSSDVPAETLEPK